MKRFLKKFIIVGIPFLLVLVIGLFLPTTPKASIQLFMASEVKDSLLVHSESPRIILIGGSNLSFGINSHILKRELQMNPINLGLNAGISLKYMMESTLPKVRSGDVIVLVPEYHYYHTDVNEINRQMLYVTFDVDRTNLGYLNVWQFFNLLPFLPKYALTKFSPMQYMGDFENPHPIYGSDSYNKFGDATGHWDNERVSFNRPSELGGKVNPKMMEEIQSFASDVKNKGARFFVSYPSQDTISFHNRNSDIQEIEKMISKYNLPVLGTPQQYILEDTLFFDSSYHLTKAGAEKRTRLLITDLRHAL